MEKKVEKLLGFYRAHKRMPTYAEMQKLLGYKSKAAVAYFVNKLVENGVINRDRSGRLIPIRLHQDFGGTKVLGVVEAGFPTSATEELIDTISLDEFLIGNKEASYILKVKGESMKDAGILPGDMVIVERGRDPKEGEIVIAEVDGEYTMKYYKKSRGRVYLEPANSKFKNIYPENDLQVIAVVKSVVRKY